MNARGGGVSDPSTKYAPGGGGGGGGSGGRRSGGGSESKRKGMASQKFHTGFGKQI